MTADLFITDLSAFLESTLTEERAARVSGLNAWLAPEGRSNRFGAYRNGRMNASLRASLGSLNQSSIIAFPTILGSSFWSPDSNETARDLAVICDDRLNVSICAADSQHLRNCASKLLDKMYGWRGYGSGFKAEDDRRHITLIAVDRSSKRAVGTLTVALDGREGLLAERMYPEETGDLRRSGGQLCEMIKFAVDHGVKSKRLLAALFHVGFVYAYRVHNRSDLLIEVTPQHAVFYRQLLSFELVGDVKLNERVNTHGVLLRLDLHHAADRIQIESGCRDSRATRSLYTLAFPSAYEMAIHERLARWERSSRSASAPVDGFGRVAAAG
jgi:hypothetical protein